MKKLLLGLTLGAIVGAVAVKKMQDEELPEKLLHCAQKKLKEQED